jgi:hypothetical protein
MKKTRNSDLTDLPVATNSTVLVDKIRSTLASNNRDFETMPADVAKRMMFGTRGWGLTRTGFNILSTHYTAYSAKNPKNGVITGKILLGMDESCASPWHVQGETVYVFDSVLHFELEMVNGNLNDFIDFKKPQKN